MEGGNTRLDFKERSLRSRILEFKKKKIKAASTKHPLLLKMEILAHLHGVNYSSNSSTDGEDGFCNI